mmetsp:Transcript_38362/g.68791  ORF Transcript_38362/g.68791 Transcript_38362/m.68791 type:complete len:218 (+) Transcript_38362:346-999(+)
MVHVVGLVAQHGAAIGDDHPHHRHHRLQRVAQHLPDGHQQRLARQDSQLPPKQVRLVALEEEPELPLRLQQAAHLSPNHTRDVLGGGVRSGSPRSGQHLCVEGVEGLVTVQRDGLELDALPQHRTARVEEVRKEERRSDGVGEQGGDGEGEQADVQVCAAEGPALDGRLCHHKPPPRLLLAVEVLEVGVRQGGVAPRKQHQERHRHLLVPPLLRWLA